VAAEESESFKSQHHGLSVIDRNAINLQELFLLRNPRYKFEKDYEAPLAEFLNRYDYPDFGSWFYFPWSNALVRYLPESLHLELRTGRNKNLITETEQLAFYYSSVVILGLSVGGQVAAVIAMTGGARHLKLVDPDTLSGDNLNRIRTGFPSVGTKKVVIAARQIYEVNPYSKIELYSEGINEKNADEILTGADLVVEEMDNPYWKFRARELARASGLPVLMATDNGDGAIVDIERFDLNRKTRLFNGLVGGMTAAELKSMLSRDLPRVAGKIAGSNLVVSRMLESVATVGKTLYSWPQLGTAANMCGSLVAMIARRILAGAGNIRSGRYAVNPDAIFESDYRRRVFSRKVGLLKFMRTMSK